MTRQQTINATTVTLFRKDINSITRNIIITKVVRRSNSRGSGYPIIEKRKGNQLELGKMSFKSKKMISFHGECQGTPPSLQEISCLLPFLFRRWGKTKTLIAYMCVCIASEYLINVGKHWGKSFQRKMYKHEKLLARNLTTFVHFLLNLMCLVALFSFSKMYMNLFGLTCIPKSIHVPILPRAFITKTNVLRWKK